MPQKFRTFIALEIPGEVKQAVCEVQARFKGTGFPFRWVNPKAMHLTLRFLGDVLQSDIDGIVRVMEQCAAGFTPMTFSAKGFGAFPSFSKARVFWTGLAGDTANLGKMASCLASGLEPLGFEDEKKRFSAHITLGRAKGTINPQALLQAVDQVGIFETQTFTVDCITLFKSDLRPAGAVYTALARASFGHTG
ncbi:MAG: RNA 2',3'-cyclic phosphodiesterase [Desulfatibacillum sp.]|nr:RNA 2',3'-cyclic phosphodiesterase [Desulfatibacillum sp.]